MTVDSSDLMTAVIIINYRTKTLTIDAISSVLSEPEIQEVVVVDNASGDGSAEFLRSAFDDRRVQIVESDFNQGFAKAVNMAAAKCNAPLVLILNSDATLVPGCLGRLARALVADDNIGIVAPMLYESDGRTLQQGAYGSLPRRRDIFLGQGRSDGRGEQDTKETAAGWVSGAAMLLRRDDFLGVDGFDEHFRMYLEDVDLCRRLQLKGKSVRREASAAVTHRGGKSWESTRDKVHHYHQSKLHYFEKLGASKIELQWIRLIGIVRVSMTRR